MKPRILLLALFLILLTLFVRAPSVTAQTDADPTPPPSPVKLIFIHHSVGENWLTDDYGNLGRELAANNYFVSDTNYGWGPDTIGDRTDIVNWREWFTGPESPRYLDAVFHESGQHSSYTRTFDDPGGENQIILFKSCFPNSALEGSPNDAPDPNEGYTVGHAKYVYNELLTTFLAHPDKLFIVITSPPLQDPAYAENARAFDDWLLNDWLTDYPYPNVAVFDFKAILTAPDNHHRYTDGQIERITEHGNTLVYDSDGDDHPNPEGSQKATEEFIPLLNIFYHRWVNNPFLPVEPLEQKPTPEETTPEEPTPEAAVPDQPLPPASSALIDDFDGHLLPGTGGWQAYWDETTPTAFTCTPEDGALHLTFDISANSWGTCPLFFQAPFDGSAYTGLTFRYRANAPARLFDLTVLGGTVDARTSYQFTLETTPESVEAWIPVTLTWDQLLGVNWEGDAGNPINPAQITGLTFGFGTYPDTPNDGEIWIDDLAWASAETPPVHQPPAETAPTDLPAPDTATPTPAPAGRTGCPGTFALGALVFAGGFWKKTRRKTPVA